MNAFSWVGLALILLSLALIVFVAATEAGLTAISRARVRLMAGQGVPRAKLLHRYIQERESLLRALALAHNLALIVAAGIGVAVLTREKGHSWTAVAIVVVAGLAVLAFLEALPRLIVARSPEAWGLRLSPLMGGFKTLFGVPARILDLPIRAVAQGRQEANGEEDEILRLMELEEDEGPIEEEERKMIRGVFGLEETTVREIMTPRTDIAAVEADAEPGDAAKLIIAKGYSRIPIFERSLDTIVGIVYAKDLIRYFAEGLMPGPLRDIARPALFVPESKRVDELLTEMRKRRVHMAIVVDEYGGTAGLVTIEDMLEEIVGEIEDEYDREEQQVVRISDTEAIFDGRVSIDDLNDAFHLDIKGEDFDTVGGCVFHLLGKMPSVGDEAETDGLKLRVLAVDGHRIRRVHASVVEKEEPDAPNGDGRRDNGS